MSPDDQLLEVPAAVREAAREAAWATLNSAEEIGETELFNATVHIYAQLVSVPRTFNEQTLLDARFKELGFKNATHAYQAGAVEAAFSFRDAIQKRLKAESEKESEK